MDSRLFNTASNEIKTSIAAATEIIIDWGDIVFIEAMILTTSSYAFCRHISGPPYEPPTIVVHQMSIRLELCRVAMELIHHLI